MSEQSDATNDFIKEQIFSSIEPVVEKAVRDIFEPAFERIKEDLAEVSGRIEALESQPIIPRQLSLKVWHKGGQEEDDSEELVLVDREAGTEETAGDLKKRWREIEAELKQLPAGDQRREELELEGFKIAPKLRELRGS
jgi:hypothetical protein